MIIPLSFRSPRFCVGYRHTLARISVSRAAGSLRTLPAGTKPRVPYRQYQCVIYTLFPNSRAVAQLVKALGPNLDFSGNTPPETSVKIPRVGTGPHGCYRKAKNILTETFLRDAFQSPVKGLSICCCHLFAFYSCFPE